MLKYSKTKIKSKLNQNSKTKENKMRKELMVENLIESGIGKRHAKEMYELYDTFDDLEKTKDKSMYFYGNAGTGKTLRAVAQCIHNLGRHKFMDSTFKFINFNRLLFDIRESYTTNPAYEFEVVRQCQKVNYLIIDDLGTEKTTEFTRQLLSLVIGHRYDNLKTTIITSNFTISENQAKIQDDRIISRIVDMCQITNFVKQHRYKRGNKKKPK